MNGTRKGFCADVKAFDMIDGNWVDVTVRLPFEMCKGLTIDGKMIVGRQCERCGGTGKIPESDPAYAGFSICECSRGNP
jgi:RecJ-like exonuclease